MSHQGNIAVVTEEDVGSLFGYLFTSNRWGGSSMPYVVVEALAESHGYNDKRDREREFLYSVSHNEHIERPILRLGNADVPTICVDFSSSQIRMVLPYKNEEHSNEVIWSGSFDEYLELDFHSEPFRSWFES